MLKTCLHMSRYVYAATCLCIYVYVKYDFSLNPSILHCITCSWEGSQTLWCKMCSNDLQVSSKMSLVVRLLTPDFSSKWHSCHEMVLPALYYHFYDCKWQYFWNSWKNLRVIPKLSRTPQRCFLGSKETYLFVTVSNTAQPSSTNKNPRMCQEFVWINGSQLSSFTHV